MTDMLDQLHHKENEIARLLTENIQLRRNLESKTAPDACPYAINGLCFGKRRNRTVPLRHEESKR